ncbi:MAG: carboxypeptidase-like regulatory domain-containing protein, partial [Bryobacterales bacterium]|nr:carboxypeptidase-like regulatory domain-containing protein [Bryobacterales bacterium]
MKRTIGLISLMLILTASHLFGQASTSLRGTITDLTGAVIPGATLTLTNVATQASRSTNSSEDGSYVFPAIAPGTYQLKATAAGFNDTIVNDLRLLVNVPATQNVQFEKIGTVAETISVSADAVQLNTTDASLGNAVGSKPILELPANARNVVGLLSLQPGVLYIREDGVQARNDPRSGNVNGARNDQSNVTLDGVDVNDQIDRGPFTSVLRVTLDSVQEFRTTTLNATADQGRSSGAQVSMVTKSGSNEVHGSTYWFHRNTLTTANEFFLNATGVERPKLIRNIGGASLGGPIIRNRVFLFGNWEHRRDAREDNVLRTVPSMQMRQGILQYLDTSGNVRQVTPAMIRSQIDPLGIGVNQNALSVLQSYPVPNDFTAGDGLNQVGFRFKAPVGLRWNTYIAKMDFVLDKENRHT